jgi:hypothetical protein
MDAAIPRRNGAIPKRVIQRTEPGIRTATKIPTGQECTVEKLFTAVAGGSAD